MERFNGPDMDNDVAKQQREKQDLRSSINWTRNNPYRKGAPMGEEEVENVRRYEERIAHIQEQFKGFIERHGGLTGAKEALIESRRGLIEEMEKDNPVWMTTFPVSEIIPGINLKGVETKERPDPRKAQLDLRSERYKYDVVAGTPERTYDHSHDLNTPYADDVYFLDVPAEERKKILEGDDERAKEILGERDAAREKIREAFEGKVVVDIAAGDNPYGYLIADRAGAKAYVAVEPFRTQDLFRGLHFFLQTPEDPKPRHELNGTPLAIIQDDMLGFLKRLPDNAVSVWCSGIDQFVIPDHRYLEEVGREISRVLDDDGAYIADRGSSAHVYPPQSASIRKDDVRIDRRSKMHIYRKINEPEQK